MRPSKIYCSGAHRMVYGGNVAVYADPSYNLGQARSGWILSKMDSFGGLLGFQPQFNGNDIHYSQYQRDYELIRDCRNVNEQAGKQASWDESRQG